MKRINKKFIIFILILFISIGFAYLSASLNIAGLIGYKGNTWNVYFDNVQMIKNDVSADKPIINNSKDSVDFNITFSEPSEIYKFSVDVVNDGTIDAMIGEFIKTGIDSTNEDYIDYSVKYSNGEEVNVNDLLMHNTKVRLIVNVEYKYTTDRLAPENTSSYSLTIKYVQANDNARKVEELVESGNNNTFVLNNAKANSLSNLKIYGNTSQTRYSGKNLYNVSDYCLDVSCVTNGSIADEDGWITMSVDNSSGSSTKYSNFFTNNLDLVIGDTYSIVVEIKSVSGTGSLAYSSVLEQGTSNGQLGNHSIDFNQVSAGDIIVARNNAVESGKWGLRTFGAWGAGQSGSITFRLSVIKGTGVTKDNFVYEPYVGGIPSPNPDYPQDIHSVKDINYIDISGKNLFDKENIFVGHVLSTTGGIQSNNTSWRYTNLIPVTPGEKYTLSWTSDNSYFQCNYTFFDKDNSFINGLGVQAWKYSDTVTIPDNAYYVRISYSVVVSGTTVTRENIQFERGSTNTTYEEYIGNKRIELNLNNLELNKIADYKDYIYNKDGEWYIHKEIGNSTVTSLTRNTTSNSNYNRWYKALPGADQIDTNVNNKNGALCNIACLIGSGNTYNLYDGFTVTANKEIILYFDKWKEKTTQEINDWLAENNVYSYYKLLNYTDEKITDTTLINQLDSLITNNLFEGTNYVTVIGSDLAPTIAFDYEK